MIPIINKLGDWAAANPEVTTTILGIGAGLIVLTGAMLLFGPIISAIGGVIGLAAGGFMLLGGAVGIAGIIAAAYLTNFGGLKDHIHDLRTDLEDGNIDGAIGDIGLAILSIPMGLADLFVDTEDLSAWAGIWENMKTAISALPGFIDSAVLSITGIEMPEGLGLVAAAAVAIPAAFLSIPLVVGGAIAALAGIEIPQSLQDIANLVSSIVSGLGEIAGFGESTIPPESLPPSPGGRVGGMTIAGIPVGSGQFGLDWGDITGRDRGGPGMAGQPVMIGRAAQPELFVPNTAGQFYPNAGDGGPMRVAVYLDSRVLFDGVVSEGQRRNVEVFAGAG